MIDAYNCTVFSGLRISVYIEAGTVALVDTYNALIGLYKTIHTKIHHQ